MFPDLVNCLLRGMKGLGAHFILRGNVQPLFKKACRVPYESTLRMSWTNWKKKWGHKENQQIMLGLPNCGNKRLIRLLEFAETISQLSISLNDEMIYEINHQVTYDPRSYECNLCNCIYRSLKKSGLQQGLDP